MNQERIIENSNYNGINRRKDGRLRLAIKDKILIVAMIGIPLISAIGGGIWGYARMNKTVEDNVTAIEEVKETPLQVAVIQEQLENVEESLDEFKIEQKIVNGRVDDKLDKIYEAIINND